MKPTTVAILTSLSALLSLPALAGDTSQWQPSLDLRYRFEHVDEDSIDRDANASTLRLRAGIVSPDWSGWQVGATVHGNRSVGSERFNSTANSRTQYPVVADPDDEGVSEAWASYRANDEFVVRVGRQRITEDNHRFIGNVGFRQLEQTFDAVSVGWKPTDAVRVDVNWLDKAHRIFGRSNPNPLLAGANLDAWTAMLAYSADDHTLAAYGHRLVFNDRPASHRNLGVRATGDLGWADLGYRVELARQEGLRELTGLSSNNYLHLRVERRYDQWHWFAAHERLEGDGNRAFQTPLATLHAHNGWTDRFLTTPDQGLLDSHFATGTRMGEWSGMLKVHHFTTDHGSRYLGNEYGLMINRSLPAGLAMDVKTAWFDADRGGSDVFKAWLSLTGTW
ncbi:alginate export family protein [Wenzhouxiangella sp. AB-CW3]|uniref:alginate export family protein n=1 Tax=Wenzhouxiangella sp. AB-CW3 TaxID=2771012 RepID=UPI00168B1166|nr:alginate export family protein [Wenzhouxiangella sp. AB-CW3]QOC21793.1 alginate export family protein [Wenzhouxiangella sp. AB-CW3]